MKYLNISFTILKNLFAFIGFYIVLMTSISIFNGPGTVKIAGHCFGKCETQEYNK